MDSIPYLGFHCNRVIVPRVYSGSRSMFSHDINAAMFSKKGKRQNWRDRFMHLPFIQSTRVHPHHYMPFLQYLQGSPLSRANNSAWDLPNVVQIQTKTKREGNVQSTKFRWVLTQSGLWWNYLLQAYSHLHSNSEQWQISCPWNQDSLIIQSPKCLVLASLR